MFSLAELGRMITDRARLEAHVAAFQRVVTPESVVLDIGAGTGIMSLLACKAGARRVYALEPSGTVQILLAAARDNGLADRVVVLQQRSTEVTLPERADIIVSDLRGVLPPHGAHFADLADARRRLLAPGGRLLPMRDTLWLAVLSAPEEFARRQAAWRSEPQGLDLRSALPFVANEVEKCRARADQLLGAPIRWASLEYLTLADAAVRGSAASTIARDGMAHGVVVWFDTELVEGIGYSNGPGAAADSIYGQIFFPWPEAVALRTGDRVSVEVRADPIGSDYIWTWATDIQSGPGAVTRFRQSTFNSSPPSPASVRNRATSFVPALSAAGQEALEILEGMRSGRTIGELARQLQAQHPDRFPSLDQAHGLAAALAQRYGA
jgi:protein arginine N-methyltransferase 1